VENTLLFARDAATDAVQMDMQTEFIHVERRGGTQAGGNQVSNWNATRVRLI
jgi:hypothetical protein